MIFGIFDFGATVTGTVGLAGSRSIATGIFLVVVCEAEEPLDDDDDDEEQDDSESVEQLRGRIQCFFTCPSHLQPLLRERDLERERPEWRW